MWDRSRGAWVVLTPEEHVRQWFVDLLVDEFVISPALIATEYSVGVGRRKLRVDVAVFEPRTMGVYALIECKAPGVSLNESTIRQAAVYNSALGARYIILTNGRDTFAYDVSSKEFVDDLSAIFLFGGLIN